MFSRAAPLPVRRVVQVILSAGAAVLVLAAVHTQARAGESRTIVVPAEDGYGFDDCLEGTKSCGRIVADAWCEANGLATATAFGRAEDVTGATPGATPVKAEPGSYLVTCSE